MDPAYILIPFLGGLVALAVRMPPLVGFLAAGFVLNALGFDLIDEIETIADLGVILLLFTIGLKLNVRTLFQGKVWGTASLHMAASTGFFMVVLAGLKLLGFAVLADSGWTSFAVIAFALSFSSTVFVVKVLEERSESRSLYGRTAIGILIMQDIFAVIFISASTGELPSPWAILLLGLIPAAPLLRKLMPRVGRGEMQVLYGVVLALVLGYALFETMGIKGDLGALIIGMLLAPHAAASGMSRALFNVKELLLVGFFVSIGLMAMPTWESVALAVMLVVLVPLKGMLFLAILSRFRLRHRTSVLASLSLTNFSEFGLIVAVIAAGTGWIDEEWLVVLSLAVAISFVVSAIANTRSDAVLRVVEPRLSHQDPAKLHPNDRPIEIGDAKAIVLGMGRVGQGSYDQLSDGHNLRVLGIDSDEEKVAQLSSEGYNIIEGDATDQDFWEKLVSRDDVDVVILAMSEFQGNKFALEQFARDSCEATIAAIVTRAEEVETLQKLGADAVFHLYDEAGHGLADDAMAIRMERSANSD
ncbi:cation:proton antiporter family protein [Natronoglycomyces albus]|uniref:Cation:proton antiporter n=1 Tax=Natronoglycomyces albus TaxID=2811108 RepID=A0A895XQM7_9ACTN|nr:cation:proton antiporter family protein [Natronoglycomyces albus]QSB05833.1 cation:proton antiporter [Natronoglycomyces albus]